jgi:RNA polymerase sigma-70 factor (ECF subfamily)
MNAAMMFAKKGPQVTAERPARVADDLECQLLVRIAAGDRAAFEALYRCYFPRLTRFLRRLMLQSHLVEEVLNDAMLVVWRKASTFNGQSKVSTWIFAIAFRRALKARSRFDDPVECDVELHDEGSLQPEEQLMHRQLGATLDRALRTISAEQRAVVELTYFHGCRYQEIANIMGCPVETVKTRMFHARRRLRIALSGSKEDLP